LLTAILLISIISTDISTVAPPNVSDVARLRDRRRPVPARVSPQPDPHAADLEGIRRTISRHLGDLARCRALANERSQDREGRIVVAAVIDRDGSVFSARLVANVSPDPFEGSCVVDAVRQWRFPPPVDGHRLTANLPLTVCGAE
jgi:TonB family protein